MVPLMRGLWLYVALGLVQLGVCVFILITVPYTREAFVCACFGVLFNIMLGIMQILMHRR